jgi:hypothetical protein
MYKLPNNGVVRGYFLQGMGCLATFTTSNKQARHSFNRQNKHQQRLKDTGHANKHSNKTQT